MLKIIAKGPDEDGGPPPDADIDPHLRPARPLSAVKDKIADPPFLPARGN
jgi:cytochrome d ubiquinol oxidase subunit I